jgi:large subunit ribosomal protein L19
MDVIKKLEQKSQKESLPTFRVGDVVDVHVKIEEGDKQRIQIFSGTVIKMKGGKGMRAAFTVRRIVQGDGVERIFPLHCPSVQDVKVTRPGLVRRSKLYYLRSRVGKATKVKERTEYERGTKKKGAGKTARLKARRAQPPKNEHVEEPVA